MNKKDDTQGNVAEWERVHNAKSFSIAAGKGVEFEVFRKLFLSCGCDRSQVNSLKVKAHQICEVGVEAGYLVAFDS